MAPPETPGDFRHRAARVRHGLAVVMAVSSGATDATAYLALGGVFTGVMTGNQILLGIGIADGDLSRMGLTLTALLAFILGALAGGRLAGNPRPDDPFWPQETIRALRVELVLLLGFAACWWAFGSGPAHDPARGLLVALAATAMGLQSTTVRRLGVTGLSTTYVTGTLITVVLGLTGTGGGRDVAARSALLLAGIIGGAACSALLLRTEPAVVPALQLVPLLVVLAVARRSESLQVPKH